MVYSAIAEHVLDPRHRERTPFCPRKLRLRRFSHTMQREHQARSFPSSPSPELQRSD